MKNEEEISQNPGTSSGDQQMGSQNQTQSGLPPGQGTQKPKDSGGESETSSSSESDT